MLMRSITDDEQICSLVDFNKGVMYNLLIKMPHDITTFIKLRTLCYHNTVYDMARKIGGS